MNIRIGMVFQMKKGDVVEGSIPFKVMCKSWVPKGGWIIESMFGRLEHVSEEDLESKWTRNPQLEYGLV